MNTAGEQNAKQAFLSLQNLEKIYPNGEKAVYNFNLDIEKKRVSGHRRAVRLR